MSNIRKFRVVREKTEAEADISKKIRKHKLNTALSIFLVIAAIVAITSFVVVQYKNQIFSNVIISKKISHNRVENTEYKESNGYLISYSKDGISCMDKNGKVGWNMTYEMQSPMVRMSDKYVAVGDYNGHIVYLIDQKGTTYEVDTRLPLRDFSISSDGVIAAILDDANNSWINLFSKTGEQIVEAKATMSKTGYPVAVTISGEVMGVSYFYVDGETMRSSVTFYNFGGVGENTTDHIVSSYDYANAVVPMIDFLDNNTSFAVADNRLMFFEGEKKPTSSFDLLFEEEIQGVYYGQKYVGLVFYDRTGANKYRLDVYNSSGEKQVVYGFDMDFKDIIIANEQIMIYNDAQCKIVGTNGKEKYAGTFNEKVYYMSKTDSPRRFMLVTDNNIGMMEFN